MPTASASASDLSERAAKADFEAGDLLFFRGSDALSEAISYRTCTWRQLLAAPFNGGFLPSHVGICCDYKSGRTLLIESTTLNDRPCYLRGVPTVGVQAHLPAVRVADYRGQVWRLRLRRSLCPPEREALSAFVISKIGQPYNYRRAAALGEFFWRRAAATCDPLPDTWFCDELAIEALKVVNRVGADDDPESFSPATFAQLVLHSGEYWPLGENQKRSVRLK